MDVMSRPDRAVFRLPAVALFVPVLLFFCITPLATAGPWLPVLFVVPIGALIWVLVARTTANSVGVTAHGLLGSKRMAWSELDRLEFTDARWAIAVGTDGRRLRLPMVRPRDLPRLTGVSGGSMLLGDDAPEQQDSAAEPDLAAAEPAETAAARDEVVAAPSETAVTPDSSAADRLASPDGSADGAVGSLVPPRH